MDRFGIFVDAGYLFAQGGALCCGTRDRRNLLLGHEEMARELQNLCHAHCGFQHLRTYWYDAAPDAQPTRHHIEVARLPGVKLRLGRLVGNRQKGVDSRIVRDLIILSQERAISVAYLLAGDEDLREGVGEAQERGVKVVLLPVEALDRPNLSPTLAMEVDDIVVVGEPFLRTKLTLVAPLPSEPGPRPVAEQTGDPETAGRAFAADLVAVTPPEQLAEIRKTRPRITPGLDQALLRDGVARLGRSHLSEHERKELRRGFWEVLLAEGDVS